ncbi:MAG: hypothetical protein RL095_1229 [Verrucomicrobiota bacterium]|jgi:4-hydroxy-tetrahydrodipicolinate synthase
MSKNSFSGVYTAILTPFRDGQVDWAAFEKMIEFQIAGGVSGIVAVGTTGESPTLDMDEHSAVIRFAVQKAKGRCTVIAGTGGNSTKEALELTIQACKDGAQGSLQVAPYYNKPTQEGMYLHFKAIAEATPMPIILYNVPGRSGIEISVATVARLAKLPTVVAMKEASGNVDKVSQYRAACPELTILSGDDMLTLPMMCLGAKGVISVISNVMPRETSDKVAAALKGDYATAAAIHHKLWPLMRDLFVESNPIPAKTLAATMGLCSEEMRLPLCAISDSNRQVVLAAARASGLKL